MTTPAPILLDEDVQFERDAHCYRDTDGTRRMSVTQALKIEGLIDYSGVPGGENGPIMIGARRRGLLVHQATAIIDRGDSLEEYDVQEFEGYVEAYHRFAKEMKYVADPEWVERKMIVELFGQRVGMSPDSVGAIDGVPTLIERKTCATAYAAWKLQTAGYASGLLAAGVQIRQRFALQLFPDGRYKLHPHDDRGDFDAFGDAYRMAAWKLREKLASLD
jgi:hypothetical protein